MPVAPLLSRMYANTMSPAIRTAKKAGIEYTVEEYEHDTDVDSNGLEATAASDLQALCHASLAKIKR